MGYFRRFVPTIMPTAVVAIIIGTFLFVGHALAVSTVAPNVSGTDNLIGAANAQWKFTVTSTQDLARGDVLQFWFPNGINMITPGNQFSVSNATLTATSGVDLYSVGGGTVNLVSDPSYEAGGLGWSTGVNGDAATSTTSTAQDGVAAMQINTNSSGALSYYSQDVTGLTPTATYTLSFYSRGGTADDQARIIFSDTGYDCGNPAFSHQYNFQSTAWECVDRTAAATYDFGSPYVYSNTTTNSYQRFNTSFVMSTGTVVTAIFAAGGSNGGFTDQVVLYDAVQLQRGSTVSSYVDADVPDTLGVLNGDPNVVYGYITTSTASNTPFSVTIGGITNPSGQRSALQNLSWTIKGGTLTNGAPGYADSFGTSKVNMTGLASLSRAGGAMIVDGNTGTSLSNSATGTSANYTFKITPTSSIPVGGKIVVEFPSDYASLLDNITVSTTQLISVGETSTSTIGSFTTSTSADGGRRIYLSVSSTAVIANDPLSVTIYNVTNPSTSGVYGADSAGPGNRFLQYTTKSNNGLLDGSFDPYQDGDYGQGMGPPPPSSVTIGGKHTVNVVAKMNTATTTRNLSAEEQAFLQIGMGNPDKGYFIGAKRLNSDSATQYSGLLDGTYRVGAELLDKTSAATYSSVLSPGERNISLLSSATSTVTTTLYFGIPDATTTVVLTGGVPGENASILATSPSYQSFAPIFTDGTYVTQGFSATGTGYARVFVKSGDTWNFTVMNGSSFGQSTNFSSGTVKYWPPAISSAYISASGTTNLGSFAYVQADKALNVSLKYAGTDNYVSNACVGVKRSGGDSFMGAQDMICNPSQDNGSDSNVYEFKVPTGAISVTVSQPGHGMPSEYPIAITATTNTRTVYLPGANNYINVTVVDSSGNSIRNASIFAKSSSGGFGQGMTGSAGTTTLYVPVGTYSVSGFAPGFGSLTAQNATVSDGSNPSVTFTVNTGNLRTISGQVTVNGSGLEGVKIGAHGVSGTSGGNGAETDASGNYTLYVPSGIYEIGGWSDQTGGLSPTTTDVSSGNASGVDWTFAGGFGTVRVTINNSSNISELFAGLFNPATGNGNGVNSWTASGTSKYADITVPAGDYEVNAGSSVTGPIIDGQAVTVLAGDTVQVSGDAQSSATLVAISGRVSLSGSGVANVGVGAGRIGSPRFFSGSTDDSGDYTLYVPANASYRVGVKSSSYITVEGEVSVTVTSTDSTGNDFTLTAADSTITGRVTGGGSSITNGWVSAKKTTDSGTESFTGAPTDGYGNYTLNVDSGSWTVFAEAPGYGRSNGTSTSAGSSDVNISLTARSNWIAPTPVVQGITDSSGGQVSSANSTLSLPANALGSGGSVITVTVVTTTPRKASNANSLKGSTISITAQNSSGQSISSLSSDATLSLTLSNDDLTELKIPESDLQFGYFDETTGQLVPMSATIDTTNHKATVLTGHFTDFSPIVGGPDEPTGLTVATTTPGQIDLSWTAPIATTSYYVIYATTTAISAFPTSTMLATTTATSYSHTGLTAGQVWYYKVAGVNDTGEGPNSDRANATVVALSAPTGLSATAASASAISLSWTAVSGATSYKVYHSSDSYATAIGSPSSNSYSDSGLSAATSYSYKVSAVNSNGESEKSSVASATTNSNSSGGGGSPAPVIPTLGSNPASIQEGATVTDPKITINLNATDADYVAISESENFANVSWLTYSATKPFTLSAGAGVKTIYVKFRSSLGGQTAVQTVKVTYQPPASSTVVETSASSNETPAVSSVYTFTKDLAINASGSEVKELQLVLKKLGFFTYPTATGYYGTVTVKAVQAYQKANGLTPNGKVDAATREKLNGGTIASATDTSAVSSVYTFTKDLAINASGNEVKELQLVLKKLGFFTYPTATGYYGTVTVKAVQAYQKANGLTPNGKVDATTREKLNGGATTPATETTDQAETPVASGKHNFTRQLGVGSTGDEVRELQQILKDAGYYTYPSITGYFGPATKAAVVAFQKAKGLVPFPGWVGPGTRAALNSL